MSISKKIGVLLGLILSLQSFGQSTVMVRFIPSKLEPKTEILIPIENEQWVYEEYSYFKQVYWLISLDTLKVKSDDIYVSTDRSIKMSGEFLEKEYCDTTINYIRNSSLKHRSSAQLNYRANNDIGSDNSEFEQEYQNNIPPANQVHELCYEQYKKINDEWVDQQYKLIEKIKNDKMNRYETFKSFSAVDNKMISEFLYAFGDCETDYKTFVLLAANYTSTFLEVINLMSEDSFFHLHLKLSRLSDSIQTDQAIKALKNSEIKSSRKDKIVRKLK